MSHHLRDGSRRGLWLSGGVTMELSYSQYIISTSILPLALRVVYENCDKEVLADTVKYSQIINHV